jgi:mannosyltransferase OCH1-like enzyme
MDTWAVHCPDYLILKWDESNFDLDSYPIIKVALAAKNYSMATDIIRTAVLHQYGGIYMDTDIEIVANIDKLLYDDFFIGYESKFWVNCAIVGSVAAHPILDTYLKYWTTRTILDDMSNHRAVHLWSTVMRHLYDIKPNGRLTKQHGLALYPKDYFYSQNYLTHVNKPTANTLLIHRCTATWHNAKQKKGFRFIWRVRKIVGPWIFGFMEGFVARRGQKKMLKELRARTATA